MMFYRGVVTTSPNQDVTVTCYYIIRYFSMACYGVTLLGDSNVIGTLCFPWTKNQNVTKVMSL